MQVVEVDVEWSKREKSPKLVEVNTWVLEVEIALLIPLLILGIFEIFLIVS